MLLFFHPLQVRGKHIKWQHLQKLYDAKTAMSSRSSGLYLLQKLKQEHVNLTSFSRMRVDLAAQVSLYTTSVVQVIYVCYIVSLSESVARAFEFYGSSETTETEIFVKTFDKFFDCLNVRNLDEHWKRRKPNLKPYTRSDDERLIVSLFT